MRRRRARASWPRLPRQLLQAAPHRERRSARLLRKHRDAPSAIRRRRASRGWRVPKPGADRGWAGVVVGMGRQRIARAGPSRPRPPPHVYRRPRRGRCARHAGECWKWPLALCRRARSAVRVRRLSAREARGWRGSRRRPAPDQGQALLARARASGMLPPHLGGRRAPERGARQRPPRAVRARLPRPCVQMARASVASHTVRTRVCRRVSQASAWHAHSLAVTTSGALYAFGCGESGRLGCASSCRGPPAAPGQREIGALAHGPVWPSTECGPPPSVALHRVWPSTLARPLWLPPFRRLPPSPRGFVPTTACARAAGSATRTRGGAP
jgi:hypothetical protein